MLSVVYVGTGRTQAVFDVTGYFTADDTGATFFALDPARVLDSRNGTGLSGKFATGCPAASQLPTTPSETACPKGRWQ